MKQLQRVGLILFLIGIEAVQLNKGLLLFFSMLIVAIGLAMFVVEVEKDK